MNFHTLHNLAKSRWGVALRFAFSLCIILLLLNRIEVSGVFTALIHVSPVYFAMGIALMLLLRCFIAAQLLIVLHTFKKHISIKKLLQIILIADFYAVCLPGGFATGNIAVWLGLSKSKSEGVRIGFSLIYLRVIGLLVLCALGIVALTFDPQDFLGFIPHSSYIFALVGIGIFGITLLPKYIHFLAGLVQKYAGKQQASWLFLKTKTAYRVVRQVQKLPLASFGIIILLAICIHTSGSLAYYYFALASSVEISFITIVWIRALLTIASILPIAVANLGIREVTLVVLLSQYGISEEQSLSFSFVILGGLLVFAIVGICIEKCSMLYKK